MEDGFSVFCLRQEQDVGGTLLIASLFTKDQFPSLCSPNIELIVVSGKGNSTMHMTLRQVGHYCPCFSFFIKTNHHEHCYSISIFPHAHFFVMH